MDHQVGIGRADQPGEQAPMLIAGDDQVGVLIGGDGADRPPRRVLLEPNSTGTRVGINGAIQFVSALPSMCAAGSSSKPGSPRTKSPSFDIAAPATTALLVARLAAHQSTAHLLSTVSSTPTTTRSLSTPTPQTTLRP